MAYSPIKTGGKAKRDWRARIEFAEQHKTSISAYLNAEYACVCLRGYYPSDPSKDNQDSHIEISSFIATGDCEASLFCVFDGHGTNGHHVARFVRNALPKRILASMQARPAAMDEAWREACRQTDDALRTNESIDDRLSGTTAVMVLLGMGVGTSGGDAMQIANIGDSRAIIGRRQAVAAPVGLIGWLSRLFVRAPLVAEELSHDHVPIRKDEYVRVRAQGARVMSSDQIQGLVPWRNSYVGDLPTFKKYDDDPPRLWLPDQGVPGCGFTRSIGDRLAKQIGVSAEPELSTCDISTADEYVVVCSDGVFEFMSNQEVIDIVADATDPLAACHTLVQKAYELWLKNDTRTDDITATVIKFEHLDDDGSPILTDGATPLLVSQIKQCLAGGGEGSGNGTGTHKQSRRGSFVPTGDGPGVRAPRRGSFVPTGHLADLKA